jgi:GT2 family glycosyltransferase
MIMSHVIPCYNEWDITRNLLNSLFKYTDISYLTDVILVDNGSIDDTSKLCKSFSMTYVRNNYNAGFPRACNQGIAIARGDLIAVWNNDIEVCSNWLDPVLSNFGDYGMISPNLTIPAWMPLSKYREEMTGGYGGQRLDFHKGCPWIFKREVLDTIGVFDEQFYPTLWEDTDILVRMSLAGYKHGVYNGSVLFHHSSVTQNNQLSDKSYQAENTKKFHDKWGTTKIDMKQIFETGRVL